MFWLKKLIWSWQEGKDRAAAAKILPDFTRLCSLAQQWCSLGGRDTQPPASMKLLAEKIAANLREAWEEGKPSQPAHVPQYGLSLYSEQFLIRKGQDFRARGEKLEERHDSALRLDVYALYIAAYYLELLSKVVYGLIMRRRGVGVLHLRI